MNTHELIKDLASLNEGLRNLDYLVLEARLSVLYPIDEDPAEEVSVALGRIGSALQGRREMLNILLEKVDKEGVTQDD